MTAQQILGLLLMWVACSLAVGLLLGRWLAYQEQRAQKAWRERAETQGPRVNPSRVGFRSYGSRRNGTKPKGVTAGRREEG